MVTEPSIAPRIGEAFAAVESYILRRDICALTTKNYNRFFVALIGRLRGCEGDKVDELIDFLSSRTADLDRWPDDAEWRRNWLARPQYRTARQPRLRYIFEAIERAKHTTRNEDIVIRSALTIEHIMPQKWHDAWPISGFGPDIDPTFDPVYGQRERARIQAVDTIGNLTLLTQGLNASVSNAAFSVKMPALQANTALALNRELQAYSTWDEDTIAARGEVLFEIARKIWAAPLREEILGAGTNVNLTLEADYGNLGSVGFPADGTRCRFTYSGTEFAGEIINRQLVVSGQPDPFSSFSAASKAVTGTSRNGWHDWYLLEAAGTWIQADLWRRDIA